MSNTIVTDRIVRFKRKTFPVSSVLEYDSFDIRKKSYIVYFEGTEYAFPEDSVVVINDMEARQILDRQEKEKEFGFLWHGYKEFYWKAFGISMERSYLPDYEAPSPVLHEANNQKPDPEQDENHNENNKIWVE